MRRYEKHITLRLLPEQLERLNAATKASESPWKGRGWFIRVAALREADRILGPMHPLGSTAKGKAKRRAARKVA
jgi:hypothetical protein